MVDAVVVPVVDAVELTILLAVREPVLLPEVDWVLDKLLLPDVLADSDALEDAVDVAVRLTVDVKLTVAVEVTVWVAVLETEAVNVDDTEEEPVTEYVVEAVPLLNPDNRISYV